MNPEAPNVISKRKLPANLLLPTSAILNGFLLLGIGIIWWTARDLNTSTSEIIVAATAKPSIAEADQRLADETVLPTVSSAITREPATESEIPPVPPPAEVDVAAPLTLTMDLIAQGWSPEDARALAIGALFQASIEARLYYDNRREYWEPISREERVELLQSHWRRVGVISELLGLQGPSLLDVHGNWLPIDRLQAVARIQDDYKRLRLQFAPIGEGGYLPEDREVQKRIAEEFQRDLKAEFSPDEWLEYRLRHSEAAKDLRLQLAFVDAGEGHFRALFELQEARSQAISEIPIGTSSEDAPEAWATYQEATEKLNAEMRKQIGEEGLQQVERNRGGGY